MAVDKAYRYLIDDYPDDEFIIMGDSAGGGLGLAYAQFIKDEDIKQPAKLVLYSAWIDIGMSNPLIDDMLEYDLLLDKEVLINAGQSYLGDGDAEDPLVSPIFGNFEGLGDILMFYGTHEMIYPDALKFESLANEKGGQLTFPTIIRCSMYGFFLIQ